ncbi:LPS assembly lipoprotein LptE [Legionella fairfieldensis]|uniref:LPS-assembly lipoprotein LptE n=1 Tax=Legionella fairfieldensis TaxID=45064 RepID=UPI0006866BFB|nr:LPS assembly lipoprotein LptE [Legionella fairfieldensis]
MKKQLLMWAGFLLLTGCGFHLRGFVDMPAWLNNVAIVIQNAHRDLGPLLKDQLESYNIKVNPNPGQASYLLIIESDSIQQQMTNVSASTAPRQYLLIYDVQFTVVKVKGNTIIPSSHVSVTRQLTVNNNRILGSNSEEAQLLSEMRRDAAMQIMNQLGRENGKSRTHIK